MRWRVSQQVHCIAGVWLCFAASPVFSETIPPLSPNTQIQIDQEQAERLQAIEKAKQDLKRLKPVSEPPQIPNIEDEPCFPVNEVKLEGNTVFGADDLRQQLQLPSDKPVCVGMSAINFYLRTLTNVYVAGGYITSRALLEPQDLSSGVLSITILEGRLEKLLFNGEPEGFLHQAFPGAERKLLNLRDIEQGLDQINRLNRYNAQIKLLPGSEQGYSIVDIQTEENHFVSFGAGFNNGGQESTGEEQLSVSLTGENFFKLLDQWSLRATKSTAMIHSKDSESLYLGVDIPVGYWNLGYRTSYSNYITTFNSQGFTFDSSGQTNSHDIELKWLFYRDDVSKSALKTTISHRREKNYILGNKLEAGSRNLSSASLAWEHSTRLAGGFMSLAPEISLGTDWFGGEKTQSQDDSLPTAQFIKGSLTGSYTYPITPALSLSSTLFGQWSNDTLYGSERLSIGGEYSVRGFKGTSISGDEGYYWRNDLNFRLGQWPYIGLVSTQVALDTGTIVEDSQDAFERGSLLGSSVSFKTQAPYASSSFTFGFPIEAPSRLKIDDYVVYYRVDISI